MPKMINNKAKAFYQPSMRRYAAALILTVVGALCSGCYNPPEGVVDDAQVIIPAVEALQARQGSLPLTERLTGVIRARNQVAIYPKVTAAVTEVLATNGQFVRKGEPLVHLRDKELREQLKQLKAGQKIALAQLKQSEAELKEAQAERRRAENIAADMLISQAELDAARTRALSAAAAVELARARVDQAEANLDEQEEILSQTVVRAPIDGTVGNRNAEIGMLVNSGTQLFTLGQLDSVRVQVILTDRMLEYIEPGQRVDIISSTGQARRMHSVLSRISPFLHPTTHTTIAEIDVANPDGYLRPGMFVAVDVHYGDTEKATLVPFSALYENPTTGGTGVFVSRTSLDESTAELAEDGKAQRLTDPVAFEFVPVDVIARGRMSAGISAVEPGQWVVTIGQDLLEDEGGQARVRIVTWDRVEQLQQMQSQDLLREIMGRKQNNGA